MWCRSKSLYRDPDGKYMTLRVKKSDKLDKKRWFMTRLRSQWPLNVCSFAVDTYMETWPFSTTTFITNQPSYSSHVSLGTRRPEDDCRFVHPTFDNCPPHPFPPSTRWPPHSFYYGFGFCFCFVFSCFMFFFNGDDF